MSRNRDPNRVRKPLPPHLAANLAKSTPFIGNRTPGAASGWADPRLPRCDAIAHGTGKRCKGIPAKGQTRCRWHGGARRRPKDAAALARAARGAAALADWRAARDTFGGAFPADLMRQAAWSRLPFGAARWRAQAALAVAWRAMHPPEGMAGDGGALWRAALAEHGEG